MTYIPRVTCEPCGQNMRVLKNDVAVRATSEGNPYYIVRADRWGCPKCGHEVLTGFAGGPTDRNFEPGFADRPFNVTVELGMPLERPRVTSESETIVCCCSDPGHDPNGCVSLALSNWDDEAGDNCRGCEDAKFVRPGAGL